MIKYDKTYYVNPLPDPMDNVLDVVVLRPHFGHSISIIGLFPFEIVKNWSENNISCTLNQSCKTYGCPIFVVFFLKNGLFVQNFAYSFEPNGTKWEFLISNNRSDRLLLDANSQKSETDGNFCYREYTIFYCIYKFWVTKDIYYNII